MQPSFEIAADAPTSQAFTRYVPWKADVREAHKTGSGVEYVVLASGSPAGELAADNSTVEINYEGRLNASGEKFDSSYTRGETAAFPVSGVIPGFSEALKLMRPGDRWLVYIPSKLGYGERGAGGVIPPNADLVFEIDMKTIMTPPPSNTAAWDKYTPWNSTAPDVKKTGSGMEYVVLASGPASGVAPTRMQDAEVFYEGRLNADGEMFDSAFERGGTETFPVSAVVPGFSEALQLMKPGDHWLVFIPSKLGYGERGASGAIPPNADLVFEILMVGVQ